ncbi:8399_t:CDS:2 [Cetraspora pellucida]|uniref:8399_t:CDS:1 n=1 Tax=Cetraspora pellucida TaxID=1433469 RepID=A0A9N9IGI5_9GLOM|nr:8399_t:CDS:2 [Cetraspora pellucida]
MSSEPKSVETKKEWNDDPKKVVDQKEPTRQSIQLPSKPYWVDKIPDEEESDKLDNLNSSSSFSKCDSNGFDWSRISTNHDCDNKHVHFDSNINTTDRIPKIGPSMHRSSLSQSYRDTNLVNNYLTPPFTYKTNFRCADHYQRVSRPRSFYPSKSMLGNSRIRHKISYPYDKMLTPSSPRHFQINNQISTISSISPPSLTITDIKHNPDNGCKSAANTLSKFIQAIGSLIIEATKNFLAAPIVIQYFADGADPIFYQGATAFDAKKIGYSQNGFYMLREFHQEVEEYLKKEFPTSQVESNGNDKKWSVSISNFIDTKQVRRHLSLKKNE